MRALVAVLAMTALAPVAPHAELAPVMIVGDAIPQPLTGEAGDPVRGRAIVVDRQKGLCLLCHIGPFPDQRFQGDMAPDLAGAGARWSSAQLRLRIADGSRLNPATIMPSYYRIEGLNRVAPAFREKPILEAQQVEDVVAFLATLQDPSATSSQKP
jgi:sulfur-oxidizing protein SoxX